MNNVAQMSKARPLGDGVAKKKVRAAKKSGPPTARSGTYPVLVPPGGDVSMPTFDARAVAPSEARASTRPIQGGCGWHDGETLADALRKQVAWAMAVLVDSGADDAREMSPDEHSIMHALHRVLALSLEVDELARNAACDAAKLAQMTGG